MADIRQGRWTAEIEGDFVVFIIGARINSKLHALRAFKDLGGRAMRQMLDYLTQHPEKGLLGYETCGFTIIQYWRSFDQLEAFAKDTDDPHLAVWRNYWKRVGKDTRAGIWHETYLVRAGEFEAVYGNMPPHGLGKATTLVPVADSVGARQRLKAAVR
jgi:Monooxygenase af470-like